MIITSFQPPTGGRVTAPVNDKSALDLYLLALAKNIDLQLSRPVDVPKGTQLSLPFMLVEALSG